MVSAVPWPRAKVGLRRKKVGTRWISEGIPKVRIPRGEGPRFRGNITYIMKKILWKKVEAKSRKKTLTHDFFSVVIVVRACECDRNDETRSNIISFDDFIRWIVILAKDCAFNEW